MAIDGLNSVYNKRGGTGQAYILPDNQAVGIFVNGLADQKARQSALDAAKLKRQQVLDDANSKTLASLSLGDHWGERTSELQKEYNALTDYALTATQNGQNLNSDRDFLQKKNQLLSKAGATKDLQKLYEQNYSEVGKNPDGYENGLDVLKSIRGASLDDFTSGKFKPEPLKKIYTLADAVKESGGQISYVKNNDGTYDTTRVNRSGNVGQAIASLNTPSAKYLIAKSGGDPNAYVDGFPTITQTGKTYFNTKGKPFEDAVIQRLATDPGLPAYLQSKGYDVSSTDSIRKSAFDFAKKQNEAAGKYVKDYADVLENKATTDTTRIFSAEANRRANESRAEGREKHAHNRLKWADEELAKSPDTITTNVLTNIASLQRNSKGEEATDAMGNKIIEQRASTSFAASNVGNAKSPFIPLYTFDPDTGLPVKNSNAINVSGGQVHIKPVLRFNGMAKILDDESLKKVKEGTYKINGKSVPADAKIEFDELLYGEERVPADPNDVMSKASVRKLILPVTNQPLDAKFDKAYDRVNMWNSAIKSMPDVSDKKRAALQIIRQYNEGKGYSEAELKEQAAAYLNTIK